MSSSSSAVDPDVLAKLIHEDAECVACAVEQLKHFDRIKALDARIQDLNSALRDIQHQRAGAVADMEAASAQAKAAIQRVIDSALASPQPAM